MKINIERLQKEREEDRKEIERLKNVCGMKNLQLDEKDKEKERLLWILLEIQNKITATLETDTPKLLNDALDDIFNLTVQALKEG